MDIDLSSNIFLVTVGVNSRHGTIKSPIFEDGTFELMPRPEERSLWAPTLPAYPKMTAFNHPGEPLSNYVSDHYRMFGLSMILSLKVLLMGRMQMTPYINENLWLVSPEIILF